MVSTHTHGDTEQMVLPKEGDDDGVHTRWNPLEKQSEFASTVRSRNRGIRDRDGARESVGMEGKKRKRENYTTVGANATRVLMRAAGRSAFST